MDSGLAASRRPGMTPCLRQRIDDIDRIGDVFSIDDVTAPAAPTIGSPMLSGPFVRISDSRCQIAWLSRAHAQRAAPDRAKESTAQALLWVCQCRRDDKHERHPCRPVHAATA
jgi:hypothetical protein